MNKENRIFAILMIVFPNCKINLGLHITGKRPDGYHNIESVMIPVGWKDTLEIVGRGEEVPRTPLMTGQFITDKVRFISYGTSIPGNAEDNLCIKVYHLLAEWFNLPSVDMHLIKTLPIGAGLGGGSADAAFCLRALKSFFDLRLTDVEAKTMLGKLGSDCPFFWDNKPAFVYGRGDEMRRMELDLSQYWIALVYPDIAISTQEAYSGVKPKPSDLDLTLLPDIPIEAWKEVVKNDFEDSVFPIYPKLKSLKNEMYKSGAIYSSLSGSGSTVFGIFEEKPSLAPQWEAYPHWIGKLTL